MNNPQRTSQNTLQIPVELIPHHLTAAQAATVSRSIQPSKQSLLDAIHAKIRACAIAGRTMIALEELIHRPPGQDYFFLSDREEIIRLIKQEFEPLGYDVDSFDLVMLRWSGATPEPIPMPPLPPIDSSEVDL